METTLSEILNKKSNVRFIVNKTQYNVRNDNRFLVPFMVYDHNEIRYGFVDKNENIVIPAIYDKVYDDFNCEKDLVRVGKRFVIDYGTKEKPRQYTYFKCGIINSKGEELIACDKYESLCFASTERLVAHGNRLIQSGCSLIDLQENVIVPYGVYDKIYHFSHGFARTRKGGGCAEWGIIDEEGNVIIPNGKFSRIWEIKDEYPYVIVQLKSALYELPIEILKQAQLELKTTDSISIEIENHLKHRSYLQRECNNDEKIPIEEWLK
jgi:hypothetical protein